MFCTVILPFTPKFNLLANISPLALTSVVTSTLPKDPVSDVIFPLALILPDAVIFVVDILPSFNILPEAVILPSEPVAIMLRPVIFPL